MTDGAGHFRFDHLSAGRYSLAASLQSQTSAALTVVALLVAEGKGPANIRSVVEVSDAAWLDDFAGDVLLQSAPYVRSAAALSYRWADLLLAVPRPKVMRRLWAPLAAIGVGQVILTNAEKVERDYFGSHALRDEMNRVADISKLAA